MSISRRTGSTLAAIAAIAIGAGIAWQRQIATDDFAPTDPAPFDSTPGVHRAAPTTTSERATAISASPSSPAATGPQSAAGAAQQPPAEPPPDRGGVPPAPLPEFFSDGLGPAPREPDGSLTEGSPHELQDRLDGERRDDDWADKVEWELNNYLALQPFTERLETTQVLCRATVCRVTATTQRAALPDADEDGWQSMMASLRYERVSNEFSQSADVLAFKASEPDRIGFITYFERRE